jgi:hypothetical protein
MRTILVVVQLPSFEGLTFISEQAERIVRE